MKTSDKTRREFLKRTALGLGALGAAAVCPTSRARARAERANKPNFVYVLCDDLGYGDLGCYGHRVIKTPRLDALAADGLKLTDCYAAAPVCSPSRAGVMTGRNPYRCGIPDWIPENSPIHLRRNETTIAKLLQAEGYVTAHYGKWHLNGALDGAQPDPKDHGFDHWFSTQNNAKPSHRNPVNFIRNGEEVGLLEGYSSTLIVEEAIRFLRQTKGRPFTLFVWFHSPHEPITTGPEFQELYADEPNETKATYYGNVSQMDHEVGRLLDALDASGLRDNTFVMFTSDNGPETLNRYKGARYSHGSPGPLRGMKLHMHEGGIRVPGIIRWPGATQPGTTSAEPVNGTDVLPTFCDIVGAGTPSDRAIDGGSILPLLKGKPVTRPRPLYWRYDRALSRSKVAMRDGEWKILADLELENFELYNLKEDLGETTDLAAKHPRKLREMTAVLRDIHQEINGEFSGPDGLG